MVRQARLRANWPSFSAPYIRERITGSVNSQPTSCALHGGNVLMRALNKTFFDGFDPANAERAAGEEIRAYDRHISQRDPSHHVYFIARKPA